MQNALFGEDVSRVAVRPVTKTTPIQKQPECSSGAGVALVGAPFADSPGVGDNGDTCARAVICSDLRMGRMIRLRRMG